MLQAKPHFTSWALVPQPASLTTYQGIAEWGAWVSRLDPPPPYATLKSHTPGPVPRPSLTPVPRQSLTLSPGSPEPLPQAVPNPCPEAIPNPDTTSKCLNVGWSQDGDLKMASHTHTGLLKHSVRHNLKHG